MVSLPTEFKEKYQKLLGEKESQTFFESIDGQSKKGFRLNPLKANYKNIRYDLNDPIEKIDNGYYGQINGNDSEWIGGYVYSQDPAAMFPAQIASEDLGKAVLDLCAAPGGKSTALAQALNNEGILVANEISASRAQSLRENLERWGASNVLVTSETPDNLAKNFKEYFDTILVDAPCSGEGMFRKDPDAIKYWSQDYVLTCQTRQKEILVQALKMLKPGGQLVYSTCTFAPEEDEQIVEWLVELGLEVEKLPTTQAMSAGRVEWTKSKKQIVERTGRFWFQNGVGEGQFVAKLRKPGQGVVGNNKHNKFKKKKRQNNKVRHLNKDEIIFIEEVIKNFNLPTALQNWQKAALNSKDHIYLPILTTNVENLRILSNGVELGLMKKKRFEPGHQLAEVLAQLPQERTISLTDEDYAKFIHGEALKVITNLQGFVLVENRGHIFSFGKIGNDKILKNYYPKGLRR